MSEINELYTEIAQVCNPHAPSIVGQALIKAVINQYVLRYDTNWKDELISAINTQCTYPDVVDGIDLPIFGVTFDGGDEVADYSLQRACEIALNNNGTTIWYEDQMGIVHPVFKVILKR